MTYSLRQLNELARKWHEQQEEFARLCAENDAENQMDNVPDYLRNISVDNPVYGNVIA